MIRHQGTSTGEDGRPAGAGLTPFALGLAKHLAAANAGAANLVFSPLSVYVALALLAAGARGRTLRELLAALDARSHEELAATVHAVVGRALADQSSSGGPTVTLASGVWHDTAVAIDHGFRDTAAEAFNAETQAVDFRNEPKKAVHEINSWVAAATNNLISSILDPASVRPDTSLIVANAIYFKGKWQDPFDAADTIADNFYRLDGSVASGARFMRSRSSQFISVRDGLKVLKLPYKTAPPPPPWERHRRAGWPDTRPPPAAHHHQVPPRHSMYVFLPDARGGLPELVKKITSFPAFWRYRLPESRVPVGEFRLPKFRLSFSESLAGVLRDGMGIRAAFDAGLADLSDMVVHDGSGVPVFAGEVCHRAVIEVNEEGTEAAAASYGICVPTCPRWSPERPVDFVADHPFVFFVVEEASGAIMFVGHVLDPSASS